MSGEKQGMVSGKLRASVVLPTHGRRASLIRVVRELGRQTVPAETMEIIVVCDGDVDGSADACRAAAGEIPFSLRVIEQANQGPAAARNRGVDEARAPLIIFIDDDVVPAVELVAAHLKAQEGQDQLITIGPLLPPLDAHLSVWASFEERTLCQQYEDMMSGRWQATYRQFYTGNAAVLKRHIKGVGGFDTSFRRAEDVELAFRLHERGLRFAFLPDARGWHYVSRPLESWLRIPAAYASADVAMARAHRTQMLGIVAREYRRRHPIVRILVELCAGRLRAYQTALAFLTIVVRLCDRATTLHHADRVCSLLFNLCYYHSFARALGGRDAFKRLLVGEEL